MSIAVSYHARGSAELRALTDSIWLLSIQLSLGSAVMAALARWAAGPPWRSHRPARRQRAAWARAGRSLLPASALGLLAVVLLAPLRVSDIDPGLVVTGSIAAAGGVLLYTAAALERRGRLRAARGQVRIGGFGVALGLAASVLWIVVSAAWTRSFHPAIGFALLAFCAATVVALLAGLSAKPRPACHAAALLYLCGLVLVVASSVGSDS